MGKRKKSRKTKYLYSKVDFINSICSKCELCSSDPTFCFDVVYKDNPKRFVKTITKKLYKFKHWLNSIGYSDVTTCPDEHIEYILKLAFCDSNIGCKAEGTADDCLHLLGCFYEFKKQLKNSNSGIITRLPKISKGNNLKAESTFFCNESFKKEIKEILGATPITDVCIEKMETTINENSS